MDKNSAKKELWRLQLNWLFVITHSALAAISSTSILSSLHQFLTNPREEDLPENSNIEPGFDMSEEFYSGAVMAKDAGSIVGALVCGFLLPRVPYWYLFLISTILHTGGYIMYALAINEWMIVGTITFSGFFIGMEMCLAYAYFAQSYEKYLVIIRYLGKQEPNSKGRVKDMLYGLYALGHNIGFFLGPGIAVVLAQFEELEQFRTIGWCNVALGGVFIILQFILFHGEYRPKCPTVKSTPVCRMKMTFTRVAVCTIVFMMIARSILDARSSVCRVLFNPILSDSFGFSETDSSYAFMGILAAQIIGSIVMLIMQKKLNSRLIAIIGTTISIFGLAALADWQSIPYDPCTEYSPFHHPELLNVDTHVTNTTASNQSSEGEYCQNLSENEMNLVRMMGNLNISIHHKPDVRHNNSSVGLKCLRIKSCEVCDNEYHCIHYNLNSTDICLQHYENMHAHGTRLQHQKTAMNEYACGSTDTFPFLTCVSTEGGSEVSDPETKVEAVLLERVYPQSLLLVEYDMYEQVSETCESDTENACHWIPDSHITGKHCDDCQPICRSEYQILNFYQFWIGVLLFMGSIPIAKESSTTVLSDKVDKENQGVAMGIAVAAGAIMKSVSLLWLDAVYEAEDKQTYVAMITMIAPLLPVLFGLIVLYPWLGPMKQRNADAEEISDSEQESEPHRVGSATESANEEEYEPIGSELSQLVEK